MDNPLLGRIIHPMLPIVGRLLAFDAGLGVGKTDLSQVGALLGAPREFNVFVGPHQLSAGVSLASTGLGAGAESSHHGHNGKGQNEFLHVCQFFLLILLLVADSFGKHVRTVFSKSSAPLEPLNSQKVTQKK